MSNILVLDAIMGSGKTTYIHDRINKQHGEDIAAGFSSGEGATDPRKYIYIAIYLEEAERIRAKCPDLDFSLPQPVGGRKLTHLNEMIDAGRNIAASHALFQEINRDTLELLREHKYTLIIDETLECVTDYDGLTKDDKEALFSSEMVYVDHLKRLRWNHERWIDYDGKFNRVRDLCDNGNLVFLGGKIILWELPIPFLQCFEEVWIATYLFEGSMMASYLKLNEVDYRRVGVHMGRTMPPEHLVEGVVKRQLRDLITVVDDPKLNSIGANTKRGNPLSASWMKRKVAAKSKDLVDLKRNLKSFYRYTANTPSRVNGWTTYKVARSHLKDDRYARGFIPVNAKATNKYINKASLAYVANVFLHPSINEYFRDHGVHADQDLYALSELVQWIWRSQIRRGDPITVYIPSERMRNLFLAWLHADSVAALALREAA